MADEVFSFRIPTELAENARKCARKRYGQKAGSIKKFMVDAITNEIEREKSTN
jgi:hypothetical protein